MRIGRAPTRPAGKVGADHVIIGEYMMISQVLGSLGEIPDYGPVGADFSLGKNYANLHGGLLCCGSGNSSMFLAL